MSEHTGAYLAPNKKGGRGIVVDDDRYLRPKPITCSACESAAWVYPTLKNDSVWHNGLGRGAVVCPNCSPFWMRDFYAWFLQGEREELALPQITLEEWQRYKNWFIERGIALPNFRTRFARSIVRAGAN